MLEKFIKAANHKYDLQWSAVTYGNIGSDFSQVRSETRYL